LRALALVACAALSLTSCNTMGGLSPAPLSKTAIDDRGIRYAFLTLDTLASLADAGIKAGWLVPGSAKANSIADGLVLVKNALNAASHAQRAGSLTDYQKAFDEAQKAMIDVQKALGHQTSLLTPSTSFVSVEATIISLRAA
jgi:hypothetical protein